MLEKCVCFVGGACLIIAGLELADFITTHSLLHLLIFATSCFVAAIGVVVTIKRPNSILSELENGIR